MAKTSFCKNKRLSYTWKINKQIRVLSNIYYWKLRVSREDWRENNLSAIKYKVEKSFLLYSFDIQLCLASSLAET